MLAPMPCYLRPHIPGASVFFTVALACRGTDVLVRNVDAVRAASLRECGSIGPTL